MVIFVLCLYYIYFFNLSIDFGMFGQEKVFSKCHLCLCFDDSFFKILSSSYHVAFRLPDAFVYRFL